MTNGYNGNSPLLSSATINYAMEEYLNDSFETVTGSALYEQMFYKQDVKRVDPKTGMRWAYTFEVAMPQGPGGYAEFTDEMWKGMQTPGLFGNIIPQAESYTIFTKFQFASIGRSAADDLNDVTGFFEDIKRAQFGPHIKAQQDEEIKKAIFNASTKHYVGEVASEDELTKNSYLTWADLKKVVESIEIEEIDLIDNMERVSDKFFTKVESLSSGFGADAAGTISSNFNVIDYNALADAQADFENGKYRTYEWFTPKFSVSFKTNAENYKVNDLAVNEEITLSKPSFETLFNQNYNNGQDGSITVFTTKEGMRQLWEDDEFQQVVQTGAMLEPGASGKYNRFTSNKKVIDVQGLIIIDMGKDGLYGTLASEGTRRELALNAHATEPAYLDATLIATPGYNFITSSSDFGKRVTSKPLGQVDSMDRMGLFQFMYVMWTFDIVIETPSAFTTLIHAGRNTQA